MNLTVQLLKAHSDVFKVYSAMYTQILETQQFFKGSVLPLEQMVDCAYLCRETSTVLDDLRKEFDRLKELIEKIACAIAVRDEISGTIRGTLATGTPDVKMAVKLPSKSSDPEGYAALLVHLGFPVSAIENDIASINWRKLVDLVTAQMADGKPPLPGIKPNDTYPLYRLKLVTYTDAKEFERRLDEHVEHMRTKCNEETEVKIKTMVDNLTSKRNEFMKG